jgi:hypothetical protein
LKLWWKQPLRFFKNLHPIPPKRSKDHSFPLKEFKNLAPKSSYLLIDENPERKEIIS